jgi:molybdopterin molybdotransferase
VSVGAFDFVPEVLQACGVTFHIRKMAIKPGRPTIFATAPSGTLVFALPGNPASALVGFELLVKPALAVLEGRGGVVPTRVCATLEGTIGPTSNRRTYIPACCYAAEDGTWKVGTLPWHGSGDSFGMATANALIVRSPGAEAAKTGDIVSIILLDRA